MYCTVIPDSKRNITVHLVLETPSIGVEMLANVLFSINFI